MVVQTVIRASPIWTCYLEFTGLVIYRYVKPPPLKLGKFNKVEGMKIRLLCDNYIIVIFEHVITKKSITYLFSWFVYHIRIVNKYITSSSTGKYKTFGDHVKCSFRTPWQTVNPCINFKRFNDFKINLPLHFFIFFLKEWN